MRKMLACAVVHTIVFGGVAVRAEEVTLEAAAPVVVKTVPVAGAKDVDPKVAEIKVTYSKPMMDKSWSPTQVSADSFPKVAGQPKYLADMKTFVLPVKLEAGRTYAILLNSERFRNFQDKAGHAALPYLLVFRTKGAANAKAGGEAKGDGAESAPSRWSKDLIAKEFDELWDDMDAHYSYFFLKPDVDWNAAKATYRPQAVQAKDAEELAAVLVKMLAPLRDMHVWIETGGEIKPTYASGYNYNGNKGVVLDAITDRIDCDNFAIVGKTKSSGFGYLLLVRQSNANEDNIRQAIDAIHALRDVPGFVVDLRSANGGNESLAARIAGAFCDRDTVYAKHKYRDGSDHNSFGAERERVMSASPSAYTRPVVCLIGPGAVSSGEGFVKMMKCLPHVTTIGMPTRGASGNPAPHEMAGTGIKVWFSRWADLTPDGQPFEGKGIQPEIRVDEPAERYQDADPTLQKAIDVLKMKV